MYWWIRKEFWKVLKVKQIYYWLPKVNTSKRITLSTGWCLSPLDVCQALLITPAGGLDGTGSFHQRRHYEPHAQDRNVTSGTPAHVATRCYCLPSARSLLCLSLSHLPSVLTVAQRGYITSAGLSSGTGLPFIRCMTSSIFISLSPSFFFCKGVIYT